MKVVLVTESFLPSINGVTSSVLKVLESLKSGGHEVLLIAPRSPFDSYMGFPVIRTRAIPMFGFPVAMPLVTMTSILRTFNPDVVHVAAPFALGRQALAVARRLKIPSVAIYQTDVAGYMERYKLKILRPLVDSINREIHKKASVNLAPTEEAANYLQRLDVPAISVWGRGVDLELFNPDRRNDPEVRLLQSKWAKPGDLLVGFVGRLALEKQVHRLLELTNLEGVSFVIVGDGPERKSLEKLFADLPVTFTGKLTGVALANAYAALDVFVHFGTEETFGQTIQEAQAAGLPVIAPARGGPKHLIDSGETGFLVEPSEQLPYLEVLEKLHQNPKLRAAVGRKARVSVEGKSWAANNSKLIEHYEDAIA